jgi:tetratricopeptide (TPR) repeat protein
MKKLLIIGLVSFLVLPVLAFSFEEMDAEGISLKAGPTDFTEELSIPWVEAALYPKVAERGREVFVEVRLAAAVTEVKLKLDYSREALPLYSDDGKNWSRVLKVAPDAPTGLHASQIIIAGKGNRSIQRTLDFVVKESAQAQNLIPLTAISNVLVMENGEVLRQILPGVKITALYKAPFYRVRLDDGREGWVEAIKVKEPTDDYYLLGCRDYQNKDYEIAIQHFQSVVQLDPRHAQAHFFLAKCYLKQKNTRAAAEELKETLALDPENDQVRALADSLAKKFLANKEYDQVLELKPALMLSLLKSKMEVAAVAPPASKIKPAAKIEAKPTPVLQVSQNILNNSVELVKGARTSKGTSLTSALNSVLSLTRSLGTKIHEDGWKVVSASDGLRVIFACRQEKGGNLESENFEWKVDPDRKAAIPINDNARLLMNRW